MIIKYTKRFKESVFRKVLPPENRRVPEAAREIGISDTFGTVNSANVEKYYSLLHEMRNLRLTKFQDYDEKNYIHFAPYDKINGSIKIQVNTDKGKIIYPRSYGDGVKINQ